MTITEFLTARLDEDERNAEWIHDTSEEDLTQLAMFGDCECGRPERERAEVEAKRRILDFHKSWPVLVESPPEFTQDTDGLTGVTMRVSKQIAWTTEQRYRETFGTEPPTGPILRALALPYADHPDYREEWRP